MEFRTIVNVPKPSFLIEPLEHLFFVGSCFADSIGRRFAEEHFNVVTNPFGVMYNPASVLHTIQQWLQLHDSQGGEVMPRIVFITLGTNHVYRLKETGQIVDNCQKRPQSLFVEEELSVAQCADFLLQAADEMYRRSSDVCIVLTVSPIRYAKYGFHGSQLSKATLLMAAEEVCRQRSFIGYFPAYEIVLDELRDYRFYQPDMIHPSQQAVEYIWERLVEVYFSERAKQFLRDWQPIKEALNHRPFHPESDEYQSFLAQAKQREANLTTYYQSQLKH